MTEDYSNSDNYFQTADLSLTATLALWCPIEAIDKTQNPRKAIFVFKKTPALTNLVDSYWRGSLRVDPNEFFNSLKAIKVRLYEQ